MQVFIWLPLFTFSLTLGLQLAERYYSFSRQTFPAQLNFLEILSKTYPELYILEDSETNQVDKNYYPP